MTDTENPTTTEAPAEGAPETPAPVVDQALTDLKARIRRHAQRGVRNGNFSTGWANTQLVSMGIQPIEGDNSYTVTVVSTVTSTTRVTGTNQAAAVKAAKAYYDRGENRFRSQATVTAKTDDTFTVTDGPADVDPNTPLNGPETVDTLKAALRQILLDAVLGVNGASLCRSGVADEFRALDLGDFPQIRNYRVETPVTGTLAVTVTGYDDESASRAAEAWVKNNGNSGTVRNISATGEATIA